MMDGEFPLDYAEIERTCQEWRDKPDAEEEMKELERKLVREKRKVNNKGKRDRAEGHRNFSSNWSKKIRTGKYSNDGKEKGNVGNDGSASAPSTTAAGQSTTERQKQ